MSSTPPTFLIIGAQKCGTSWLARALRLHPDIHFSTPKETHYFNKSYNYCKGAEWYLQHFDGYAGEPAVGEATPNYFWTGAVERDPDGPTIDIPERVYRHDPDLQLILLLREPVARAVSAYYHHIRALRYPPGERLPDVMHRYGILSMGFYDVHLRRWLSFFPREQFLILFFEESVVCRRAAALEQVYRFLNVDPSFRPTGLHEKRHRRSPHLSMRLRHVSSRLAHYADRLLPEALLDASLFRIPVSSEERNILAARYAPHNEALEALLGRPLPPAWDRGGLRDGEVAK